ncbi:ATP-binding cassette domain-containing protein, partial [bacterium]|nr:ATP-binding cassette domain-containing protein [candidate division CSSED10-310 bacterium]
MAAKMDARSFGLLRGYLHRYRWHLAAGMIALIGVDGLQILVPWLVKMAIDLLTHPPVQHSRLITIGVVIMLLGLGVGCTRFVWRYFIIGFSRRLEEDLRNRLYQHLQRLSFAYFDRTAAGDLMAHATNDLEAVRMMCGMALVASMDALVLMVASMVMMLSINAGLTAYVLIPMPFVTATILYLGPRLHGHFKKVQEDFSNITQKAQETFAGVRVVKSFVQEEAESDNFRSLNKEYIRSNMRLVLVWGFMHPVIWTISGICSVIILWVGGERVISARMTMGDFVAFNSYLGLLIWPMIAVGWVTNLYQRGKASLERLHAIFQVEPDIVEAPDAYDGPLTGTIEFRNLSFAYNGGPQVLKSIDLVIEPGQWVVVMGATGSAKTTLVNLIGRCYDPPPGALFVDGRDVR